ncbi:dna replication helicase [Stylonychia lemnae]|uniref:DNA replication ATP-dependent helicase/nuclease n=1 Tax=Stylonychia lemnae TaxID=5949 RepID=A0A078B5D2_STYLE|nr:dna replication helicase [Stylonychia lemnae]|eukprot:CDW88497.1 dna replication helicase [Stylonychia lemnae]
MKTVRNEICILVQRRNELAKLQKISSEGKAYALPSILVDQDVCRNCYVNKVCSFYSKAMEDQPEKLPTFQAYLDVEKVADQYSLTYFKKWYDIIALEQSAVNVHSSMNLNDRKQVKDEGLKITNVETKDENNGEFIVNLERPYFNGARLNTEIVENSFVNLHTVKSISFTKGLVLKKHLINKKKTGSTPEGQDQDEEDDDDIMGEQGKTEKQKQKDNIYIEPQALGGIDYKEVDWWIEMESFQTFQFNIMRHNLQNLCIAPENQKFRDLIIKQRKPEYNSEEEQEQFKAINDDILEKLNPEQVKAIVKSFNCIDYQMIIGVPGSGKHEVLSRMLLIAKRQKVKILVMAMNNLTIDNLLLRLLELQKQYVNIEKSTFVRVCSNHSQINPKLKDFINPCTQFESQQLLYEFIAGNDIFCASTMSVFNTFFSCIKFDYCILDEASLITEPLSIGPIIMADKFIMIGDYYLLNPIVKNVEAEKKGMSISLFRKLSEKHPMDVVILKKQYRMANDICSLINAIAYKGLIKHGIAVAQGIKNPRKKGCVHKH